MKQSSWQEVRSGIDVPTEPGYYALYSGKVLVYIGSTTNLRIRLGKHLCVRRSYSSAHGDWIQPKNPITRAKFKVSRRLGDWLMGEWRLITRLQPKNNSAGVTRRRA